MNCEHRWVAHCTGKKGVDYEARCAYCNAKANPKKMIERQAWSPDCGCRPCVEARLAMARAERRGA